MPLIVVICPRNSLLVKGYVSYLDGDEWFNTDTWRVFRLCQEKIHRGLETSNNPKIESFSILNSFFRLFFLWRPVTMTRYISQELEISKMKIDVLLKRSRHENAKGSSTVEGWIRFRERSALCTRGRKLVCRKTSTSSHIEYKKRELFSRKGNPSCILNRHRNVFELL